MKIANLLFLGTSISLFTFADGEINPPGGQPASAALMLTAPEIFSPGIISGSANDGAPTFTPDGNELYFARSGANWSVILEAHRINGHWEKPKIASFSGEWSEFAPALSPDGTYLVYVSLRPKTEDPKSQKVANLWRVNRVREGWSAPIRLPDSVNIGNSIWKPSIAPDGSIYFVAIDSKGGKRLYESHLLNGIYQGAQPLPFSDGTTADVDPEVAPDGSFLIFCSSGRLPGNTKDHLFVVFKVNDSWGPVLTLRYPGDDVPTFSEDQEPRLAPGGRLLYFSSDRSTQVPFPRSVEQARVDLQRLEDWDNSNSNVWVTDIAGLAPRK